MVLEDSLAGSPLVQIVWQRLQNTPITSCLVHTQLLYGILFERSEFLIATCKKKRTDRLCVCPDVRLILVLVWKNCLGFSVGYQRAPGTSVKKKARLVPASASLPTAGSALPPVGRATPLLWCSDVNTKQQFLLWGRPPK